MKLTPTTKRVAVGLLAAALPLSMAACTKGASSSSGGAGGELTMWTHNAGNKAALAARGRRVRNVHDYDPLNLARSISEEVWRGNILCS